MPSSSITANNSVPILQLDNVHVIVSRKSVLSIDSFILYPEDVYAVMGPNGAGKTTFLRTILRLQKNTSGKILFENEEITKSNLYKVRSQIGYIPQQSVINSEFPLTVRETVATGRAATIGIFHRFHTSDWNLIDLWLEKLGLLQLRNRSINELSGGEQRKVLIARAMVQEPKLLLLDEPTANLDLYWREQIIQLIHSLYLQTKIAMVCPRSTPAPGKQLLRKDLQEPLFAQAGKRSSQEARQGDSCREKEALLSLEEQATRMYDT